MATENVQTISTFGNDKVAFYMQKTMLERAEETHVATRYGMPVDLPAGQGDTVQFVRYERPGLPLEPLSDGVTPDGQNLVVNKIQAVVDQWGGYFTLSDRALVQVNHPMFEEVVKLAGEQWGRVRDRECLRVLMRATQVYYQGAAVSRATLGAQSYPTTGDVYKIVEALRGRGAPTFDEDYVAIMDTASEFDFIQDATFVATKTQGGDSRPLDRGEFMRWGGVKFVRTNSLPSYRLDTNNNATLSSQAVSGSEVTLSAGGDTRTVVIVGCDGDGQELTTGAAQTQAVTATQVLQIITPAFPANITSYNIYVSTGGGGVAACALQKRNAGAGVTYRVSASGTPTAGTAIAFSSSGQLVPELPAAGVTAHMIFFLGRYAYACTKLGNVVPTLTAPTTESRTTDSDPLGQRRKVGFKGYAKDAIVQQNWIARMEAASRYTGYVSRAGR